MEIASVLYSVSEICMDSRQRQLTSAFAMKTQGSIHPYTRTSLLVLSGQRRSSRFLARRSEIGISFLQGKTTPLLQYITHFMPGNVRKYQTEEM